MHAEGHRFDPDSLHNPMQRFTNLFPVWLLIGAALAFFFPPLFTWMNGSLITGTLGIIMLGMGITLELDDFRRIKEAPGRVFAGFLLQYSVMPLAGYGIAYLFSLPTPLAVGLILVSSCPGGTASNVVSYIAKADVALSVSMTALSTFVAAVMTPTFTYFLAGSRVEVPFFDLLLSTVSVVILPVGLGLWIHRLLPRFTRIITPFAPPIAVLGIIAIVGSILASSAQAIISAGWSLIGAVATLHSIGFLIGYLASRFFVDEKSARTISIEVGMQNSGLGAVLSRLHFANPLTAVPSAISSLVHSIIGSVLAWIWRMKASV